MTSTTTARLAGLLVALLVSSLPNVGPNVLAQAPDGTAKGFRENLVVNGDFTAGLSGWEPKGQATVQTVDGFQTLSVSSGGVIQQLALDPAWRTLRLSMRLRTVGVQVGDQDWKTARLAMAFYKADGQRAGAWPNVFACSGTAGWAACQRDYAIPKDAVRLEITPANFGTSGHADFQDIRVEALDPADTAGAKATGVVILATPGAIPPTALPDRDRFHLFVLMGQSNMHGLAPIPAAYRKPHPRVLSLQLDGQWVPATTPLDMWRMGGFSLGESFARHYAELHPDVTVGLVMAAQASDSIEELSKGAVDKSGRAVYDDALRVLRPALAQGTLKAVLWHQGEANASDSEYPAKLERFVQGLRADADNAELPFIAGELGRFATWTDAFNQALPAVLKGIPHTALASSEGLADRGDKVHFSGESAEILGRRYLAAYFALVEPQLVAKVDVAAPAKAAPEPSAAPSGKAPVILLKLDDVGHWISPRWQRTADYLQQNNLKASFGIIGQGLEKAGPETVKWIQERHQSGMVEFWHHGYKQRTATDTGEFEQGSVEEQKAILEKTETLAREKLGFELSAFGPHWSGTTPETELALEAIPAIKVWFYGPKEPKHFTRLSIPRVMALENPTFVPDFEKFKATYEKTGCQQEVLVLQGHPDAWGDPSRWEGFVKIIEFLKSKGCVFMTPSEYWARGSTSEADTTFPFAVPWDDTLAGVATDVSFLNEKPAGKNGPIIVKDGHFAEQDTGRRIRFFGVNLCGTEAFPEKADAAMFAKRLAKAGVNIVRLHHMDNSWPTPGCSIWDRNHADRQHLDAAQLDRLDYLVDQLKRNGIYVNLNLKVSKHLSSADGLPESIAQVPFLHQKRIDFFQRRMIDLQKDYARALLTHTNAYTGLSYTDDPAVACVEINNENSLLGFWTRALGQGLETLPEPFKTELETLWTTWLRKRYASTDELKAAWLANATPPGESILSPASPWTFEAHAPSVAEMAQTPSTEPQTAPGVVVTVKQNDPLEWHIQAHLAGLTLTEGAMYTVAFRAKADKPASMRVNVRLDVDDWRNMGLESSVSVGPELRPYLLTFRASGTVPGHARLGFMLGRFTGTVQISDVTLSPGMRGAGPREDDALDGLVHMPGVATERQASDWLAFLVDTERAYADEMHHLLKEQLKVRANVALTQIDYGGTAGMNREQQMDFADSHAYWQHPSFANNDWNPNNWMIANSPQVAAFGEERFGVLGGLAMTRVAGKPFSVSEYDHPAPSDYVCEMMPEFSTFAALQDWDCIYTFTINTYAAAKKPNSIQGYFDQNNHPAKWAFYPTAALIFRQGLIPPAATRATLQLPAGMWRDHAFVDDGWRAASGARMGFLTRRLAVSDRPLPAGEKARIAEEGETAGDTILLKKTRFGQAYVAATPSAVVFAGHVGGETLVGGACTLTVREFGNQFAAVTAVATDGQPLGDAKRVLITVCGRVENQDMGWNAARTTVGSKWGKGPTVAQHVPAQLSLHVAGPRKVFALAPNGQRAKQVAATRDGDQLTFAVQATDATLLYEMAAE